MCILVPHVNSDLYMWKKNVKYAWFSHVIKIVLKLLLELRTYGLTLYSVILLWPFLSTVIVTSYF